MQSADPGRCMVPLLFAEPEPQLSQLSRLCLTGPPQGPLANRTNRKVHAGTSVLKNSGLWPPHAWQQGALCGSSTIRRVSIAGLPA